MDGVEIQGHMILHVTLSISTALACVTPKIGRVTCKFNVTLNFKIIRQSHTFGSIWNELSDLKSIGNKNKFIALAFIVPETGKVMQNYVTLNFKVIRHGRAFLSSWNEFLNPQKIRNKHKIIKIARRRKFTLGSF